MLSLPALTTVYFMIIVFILGLVFGSFFNAWAWRLAHGESIAQGRSHCVTCGHPLSSRDLVPLLSYFFLAGHCRYCGAPISKRYPAVELISALFFLSILLHADITQPFLTLRWLIVGCLLLTLSLVDLDTLEIPNSLIIGIALAFAALTPLSGGLAEIKNGLLGALIVSIPLLLFVLFADKITGRETMGGGDIKLIGVLALHFGATKMLLLLIIACIFGLLSYAILNRYKKSGKTGVVPFGPALAGASWFVMLFGTRILSYYFKLFL